MYGGGHGSVRACPVPAVSARYGSDPRLRSHIRLFDHGRDVREPQHANFSARQIAAIGNKLVYPLAILQGVTGVLLIIGAGMKVQNQPWLLAGIVLYIVALTYALTVQRNALHHLIEFASTPPPPGTPPGPPPPEIVATVKKIQRGAMVLGVLIVVIVFLMVVKPGA